MKRPLLAIVALVLMAIPTQAAGLQPELPDKYHGHWCYDYATDSFRAYAPELSCHAFINITPTSFAMSDGRDGPKMYCTLKSTSLKLDVFKCSHPPYETRATTTEHMRLHIDHNDTLHLGWKTGARK